MRADTETGGRRLSATERKESEKRELGGEGQVVPQGLQEGQPCTHSAFQPPGLRERHFCCLKLRSLWRYGSPKKLTVSKRFLKT